MSWDGRRRPGCPKCGKFHHMDGQGRVDPRCPLDPNSTEPNFQYTCEVCDAIPVVPATGLCGPCTFGEADTINGNW